MLFDDGSMSLTANCNGGISILLIHNGTSAPMFLQGAGTNSDANGDSPTPVAFLKSVSAGGDHFLGIGAAAFSGPIVFKTTSKVYDVQLSWDETSGSCFVTGTVLPV